MFVGLGPSMWNSANNHLMIVTLHINDLGYGKPVDRFDNHDDYLT
jgi:hypothetical protein